MKKIQYIAPSIKVANIQLQNILAGSLDVDPTKPTNQQFSKRGGKFNSADFEDEMEDMDY